MMMIIMIIFMVTINIKIALFLDFSIRKWLVLHVYVFIRFILI